jgi:hypothetical protein
MSCHQTQRMPLRGATFRYPCPDVPRPRPNVPLSMSQRSASVSQRSTLHVPAFHRRGPAFHPPCPNVPPPRPSVPPSVSQRSTSVSQRSTSVSQRSAPASQRSTSVSQRSTFRWTCARHVAASVTLPPVRKRRSGDADGILPQAADRRFWSIAAGWRTDGQLLSAYICVICGFVPSGRPARLARGRVDSLTPASDDAIL